MDPTLPWLMILLILTSENASVPRTQHAEVVNVLALGRIMNLAHAPAIRMQQAALLNLERPCVQNTHILNVDAPSSRSSIVVI
jgi:hypothetical protein